MDPMPACVFTDREKADEYVQEEREKDENKFLKYDILDVVLDPEVAK